MISSRDVPSTVLVDTHVHLFDAARFPYWPGRAYTPGSADLAQLRDHLQRIGADHVVLVQPSVYGSDNAALLDALRSLGPSRARGVAVVEADASVQELEGLRAHGVRGLRVNVASTLGQDTQRLGRELMCQAERAQSAGLFLEVYARSDAVAAAAEVIAELPVPVILDHFGGVEAGGGATLVGRDAVIRLASSTNVWVKLSAPIRGALGSAAIGSLVDDLVDVAPGRLIWGSDWPHTGGGKDRAARDVQVPEPFRDVDDVEDLARVRAALSRHGLVHNVLGENAARLFEFPTGA